MKKFAGLCGLVAVLMLTLPAGAAVFSDPLETFVSMSPTSGDDHDSKFDGTEIEAPWTYTSAQGLQLVTDGSQIGAGWYAANQGWNGGMYTISQDTTKKSEGSSSMKLVPNDGELRDIFIGVKIDNLVPGEQYVLQFDMAMDPGSLTSGMPPGSQAGDDYQSSVSWNLRNTLENDDEDMGDGLMTTKGFEDSEDYPSHERDSVWIGDPSMWDGNFHTHGMVFTADGTYFGGDAALIIKIRSHSPSGNAAYWIDNLVVTPEPASLALFLLGGLAVIRRRR